MTLEITKIIYIAIAITHGQFRAYYFLWVSNTSLHYKQFKKETPITLGKSNGRYLEKPIYLKNLFKWMILEISNDSRPALSVNESWMFLHKEKFIVVILLTFCQFIFCKQIFLCPIFLRETRLHINCRNSLNNGFDTDWIFWNVFTIALEEIILHCSQPWCSELF